MKCPYCDNKYVVHVPRNFMQAVPFLIYLFFIRDDLKSLNNEFLSYLVIAGVIMATLFCILSTPIARYEKLELINTWCAEHRATCSIKWNKKFTFLRFLLTNGFITPVCFSDEKNNPISQMWSLSFRGFRHIGKKTICKVDFVVDTAPAEDLFIAGNRFFIFYKEQQIGEGVIKKLDY